MPPSPPWGDSAYPPSTGEGANPGQPGAMGQPMGYPAAPQEPPLSNNFNGAVPTYPTYYPPGVSSDNAVLAVPPAEPAAPKDDSATP
jgi:hypothetical protein